MSGADIGDENLSVLLEVWKRIRSKLDPEGRDVPITILLGAGASAASDLPTWNEFVIRLLLKVKALDIDSPENVATDSDEVRRLAEAILEKQDPIIVAEGAKLVAQSNGINWNNSLRESLYEGLKETDLVPSPLHLAAVGHCSRLGQASSLVTLNFDTLLEKAFTNENQEAKSICTKEEYEKAKGDTQAAHVHHLHGLITLEECREVVLTYNEFMSVSVDATPWQIEPLKKAIQEGILLIAGTTYRDPDLRQWLHVALQGRKIQDNAFVLLTRQGFGLGKADFSRLKRLIVEQWSSIGLRPILLEDHTDAAQFIRELRSLETNAYISPKERVRKVWKIFTENFDDLQEQYANLLRNFAETLAGILESTIGDRAMNLTLWFAGGDDRLYRWASHDRRYVSADSLFSIATGHDSPWIAGECLAKDTSLVKKNGSAGLSRWKTVIAVPISLTLGEFSPVACGVLTWGLPLEGLLPEDEKSFTDALVKIAHQLESNFNDFVNRQYTKPALDCVDLSS